MKLNKLIPSYDLGDNVLVGNIEWLYTREINDQYISYSNNIWVLWNYFRKLGAKTVYHKIKSRLKEKKRNKKSYGIGIGIVVESTEEVKIDNDDIVLFFAYNHNVNNEILVLRNEFVCVINYNNVPDKKANYALIEKNLGALKTYIGWSPYSGIPINSDDIIKKLDDLNNLISSNLGQNLIDHNKQELNYFDQINTGVNNTNKPSAVLFGLGNYAKTRILPNIKPYLDLKRVHEIDPDQLEFFNKNNSISLDTSPIPRANHKFDSWFIAGYHHTHVDLALHAINQGSYAVIEKPLATNLKQFQKFINAINNKNDSKFFICFHKRYSKLNDYAVEDLNLKNNEPVDMHCIVYEIPLPKYHWYNWPNSGSRLVSNGCHWIDYFMFINSYSEAVDYRVWNPKGTDVSVQIRLENGAYLNMSLTEIGSARIGVRDHIELRKGEITVKIIDASYYVAENNIRVFNRKKVNPTSAYSKMYQTISQKIANNEKGDSVASLRSSNLTLLLEELNG